MNKYLSNRFTKPTLWDDFLNRNWYMNDHQTEFMQTDISKRKGNYVFDINIPGYAREDICVKLENGYLMVTAEKSSQIGPEKVEDEYEYLHKERYCGKYSRSFYIGCSDETKANAVYHNGVLTVVIPESCAEEQEKGKYITIN